MSRTPKQVKAGTPKSKPVTPKIVPKTSPRTPKASPKAKEAKETLAKIAFSKTSPKAPNSKIVPVETPPQTGRQSRASSAKVTPKIAAKPSPKVSPKVTPPKVTPVKGKITPSKVTPAKGKITPSKDSPKIANKPSPRVSPKVTKPSPKVTPKVTPARGKASPKTKAKPSPKFKKTVEESSDDEPVEFKSGELIDAEWSEDGLFYSAKIIKVIRGRGGITYDVEFTQDGIQKRLSRDQIQSYSEESSEPIRRSKVSVDDQEYIDGSLPVLEEDASVESDSDEEPRRKIRKQAPKRKRVAPETVAVKKRKLQTGLDNLTQRQLVTLVNQVCTQNPKLFDIVLEKIPEKKLQAKRGRK